MAISGAKSPPRPIETVCARTGQPLGYTRNPLPLGLPTDRFACLRTLIGMPHQKLRWWTKPPPDGEALSDGWPAGSCLGRIYEVANSKSGDLGSVRSLDDPLEPDRPLPGYCSVKVKNPHFAPNNPHPDYHYEFIWINAWKTQDKKGMEMGTSFCEILVTDTPWVASPADAVTLGNTSYGKKTQSSSDNQLHPNNDNSNTVKRRRVTTAGNDNTENAAELTPEPFPSDFDFYSEELQEEWVKHRGFAK